MLHTIYKCQHGYCWHPLVLDIYAEPNNLIINVGRSVSSFPLLADGLVEALALACPLAGDKPTRTCYAATCGCRLQGWRDTYWPFKWIPSNSVSFWGYEFFSSNFTVVPKFSFFSTLKSYHSHFSLRSLCKTSNHINFNRFTFT